MCGIVGYVGKQFARNTVVQGLSRLEYRGYDSAGFVCLDTKTGHFSFHKEAGGTGPVARLAQHFHDDGHIGMGHTRWATHGAVNQDNSHPHFDCKKTIAVVHNGIIEHYQDILNSLRSKGHAFQSETDTELTAHLLEDLLVEHSGNLRAALAAFLKEVKGAYALVFMLEQFPDTLVLLRQRSPLVVGFGQEEMFVGSDYLAFADKTNQIAFLPDETFALLTKDRLTCYNASGNEVTVPRSTLSQEAADVDKNGFEHYMLKEIYEQKRAITRTLMFCKSIGHMPALDQDGHKTIGGGHSALQFDSLWRQLGLETAQVRSLKHLNLIGAGTSWHAARIAQFFFEIVCKIPTRVYLASEFRHMPFFPEPDSLFIFISQSGETADTLEALRLANSFGQPTATITNVPSSTMVREAGGFLPMQAGPEVAVASTKAFSTQVALMYWLAHLIAFQRETINERMLLDAERELLMAAETIEATIGNYKLHITQDLAPMYAAYDRFIFLGRHVSYPFAMEAALKLKEISYIFAQCYPAGELKHGPIALIDEKTPVVLFSVLDDVVYRKLISNAHEVKARNGHILVFAFEGQHELINIADHALIIPRVAPLLGPLAMTGLMQFLIYHITRELGCPIDRPRNLAKSVTVE